MSMLSAQCDELRELATRYDELQAGAVKAVTMPSNMGPILREAADTIWQLRDDLQRANAAVQDAEHDESMAWDRVRKAEAENAKLRELVRDMYKAFMHGNCYRWCEFKEPCNYISDGRCQWYDRMRELGYEPIEEAGSDDADE